MWLEAGEVTRSQWESYLQRWNFFLVPVDAAITIALYNMCFSPETWLSYEFYSNSQKSENVDSLESFVFPSAV
jgi:hypothetical protein